MKLWPRSRRRALRKSTDGKVAGLLARHGITCVIDIGANAGQTGKMLRRHGYRGRIISFEPGPDAHAALCLSAANDDGWTVAERLAVGAEPGTITMNISEATDMSSALAPTAELLRALPRTRLADSAQASVTTVAAIVADYGIAGETLLLKIDTQGMEMAVLTGAEPVLSSISGLHVEMSLRPLYEGEPDYLTVLHFLRDRGFEPAMLTERTFSETLGRQLQVDGLFFRQ